MYMYHTHTHTHTHTQAKRCEESLCAVEDACKRLNGQVQPLASDVFVANVYSCNRLLQMCLLLMCTGAACC